MHPAGERILKDIDEPERLFELEIDGVEVTQAPAAKGMEDEWDRRAEELATGMSERINKSVFESLERSLGKLAELANKLKKVGGEGPWGPSPIIR